MKTKKSECHLDIEYVKNGMVCINAADYNGNVYNADGVLCKSSIMHRFDRFQPAAPFKNTARFINDDVVFMGGGYVFGHFGHFLIEGLARVWPVLNQEFKNKKYVFVVKKGTKSLPGYALQMLNGLGIKSENIILIHKTTKFAGVYVPVQAAVISKYICPIMQDVFSKIAKNLAVKKSQTYDKIYLSRSKMNDGRLFGESAIENMFSKNGYKIIWPEKLPLSEQISLVSNCKVMAGAAGTALHLALFMRPGGCVIQIQRNISGGYNSFVQQDICDLCGLDFINIPGSLEKIPTPHFTSIPQIIGITPQLKKFFDDNKFDYTDKDVAFDDNAWKQYMHQLHKYKLKHCYNKFIKFIARLISFVGLTRYGRQVIRETFTDLLCID